MAKNLNAPEHWAAWIKACQKDPRSPLEARGSLGMVTGQDRRALHAVAALWDVYLGSDDQGAAAAMAALSAVLPAMQEKCWPFARELAAQQGEWEYRETHWPRVMANVKARRVVWRGSVMDLATDLQDVLTREQGTELALALLERMNVTDMAALRSLPPGELTGRKQRSPGVYCEPWCTQQGEHQACDPAPFPTSEALAAAGQRDEERRRARLRERALLMAQAAFTGAGASAGAQAIAMPFKDLVDLLELALADTGR